jgi:translocator protein
MFGSVLVLLLAFTLCMLTGAIGAVFTAPAIAQWYACLNKPWWAPPSWLFGPVWTLLYAMMATAAWLVWRQGGWAATAPALAMFVLQLGLNVTWSGLFFGLRRPDAAFVEIVLLWYVILATLILFGAHCRFAAWLLSPYLLWVTFAVTLNYAFWKLNPVGPAGAEADRE